MPLRTKEFVLSLKTMHTDNSSPMNLRFFVTLALLSTSAYLSYHAVAGPKGYHVLQERRAQALALQAQCQRAHLWRNSLRKKILVLRRKLDQDLLEQYAWTTFQMTSPKKKVILCR
jgi:cell division protein FtsB